MEPEDERPDRGHWSGRILLIIMAALLVLTIVGLLFFDPDVAVGA